MLYLFELSRFRTGLPSVSVAAPRPAGTLSLPAPGTALGRLDPGQKQPCDGLRGLSRVATVASQPVGDVVGGSQERGGQRGGVERPEQPAPHRGIQIGPEIV